ncbi:MAG: tRNA (adenosine(37)-N6)-threonylcarbamoyltransferase complex dimerization subunit type 1 TsaB [Acidobacteriota bacterium]|nr:tRNA (adenosine(37)-N6)-threonylcarbamoyltransferase complex dimerization subunit type 1 TsaB [Acidobacteriota bacterium]
MNNNSNNSNNSNNLKNSENSDDALAENPPFKEIILALETGVEGGSISLFRQGEEIDFWVGSGTVSRSEDILEEMNEILLRNDTEKKNIGRVVFSRGPGSYTGLRIGASIAKGLSKSLNCELSACAVLRALAINETENVVAAVPFGGRQVCWRFFQGVSGDDSTGETETFVSELRLFAGYLNRLVFKPNHKSKRKKLILHDCLYKKFAENDLLESTEGGDENISVINVGNNLARFIAEQSFRDGRSETVNDSRLIYPTTFENRDL